MPKPLFSHVLNLRNPVTSTTVSPPSGPAGPPGDLAGTYPNPVIAPFAVTTDKLAVNASIGAAAFAQVTPSLSFTTVETTVLTFPSITTRGGRVRLLGHWATSTVSTAQGSVIIRVKRDGGIIYVFTPLIGAAGNDSCPVPFPSCIDLIPPAGAHIYTVTIQSQSATVNVQTGAAIAGNGFVEEAA